MAVPRDESLENLIGQLTRGGDQGRPPEGSPGARGTAGDHPSVDSSGAAFGATWLPLETLADRYQLEDEIGRGGMGIVYRTHDTQLKRTVAVELISCGTVEPFRSEAQPPRTRLPMGLCFLSLRSHHYAVDRRGRTNRDAMDRASTMSRLLVVAVVFVLTAFIAGCDESEQIGKTPLDATSFKFRLDEGILLSDDYYVTNNSPHVLNNVHVTFTATGVNNDRKSLKQFWGRWDPGQEKTAVASIPDHTVRNIQRILVSGYSDVYRFSFVVNYNK